ncbi:MAG: hypothetical protein EOM91_04610 [Sphingobacteriia bacterium]|nr:hypothetical protein [Sphingobacteriia bacterium]NCC39099.1 hypothetical protein [Gammaproteobacteria bacterium]
MSKFAQPARSVRDIKTLAGKSDDLLSPHKMYMRLFALETERHRRLQERASAMLRVNNIDARCAEIDQEMKQLLALIDPNLTSQEPTQGEAEPASTRAKTPSPVGRARRRPKSTPTAASVPDETIFEPVKIRY